MKIKTISALLIPALPFIFSGCASLDKASVETKKTESVTKFALETALQEPVKKNKAFSKELGFWVNPTPIQSLTKNDIELPALFRAPAPMTFPGEVELTEIVASMARIGVDIKIMPDALEGVGAKKSSTQQASNSAPQTAQRVDSATMGVLGVAQNNSNSAKSAPSMLAVSDFVHRGDLKGALDVLCAKLNLSWKWNGASVEIFKYSTKTFYVTALSGSSKITSSISSNVSTSGGSSTGQNLSSDIEISTWADVESYLNALLSSGGKISIMESTGLVTVKDTPLVVARVEEAIKKLNEILSKQIQLNVDIYSVAVDDNENFSMGINGIGRSRRWYDFNTNVNAPVSQVGNTLGIDILTGPFRDTSITMSSLAKMGKSTLVNSFPLITTNGQALSTWIGSSINYIKQLESSIDNNGNKSISAEIDVLNEGINLNILPKVQPDGAIMLKFNLDLSRVESMNPQSFEGNQFSLPVKSMKNIEQRVSLKNGRSLILSGFKENKNTLNQQGTGWAKAWMLGGGHDAANETRELVVVITPYVSNNN